MKPPQPTLNGRADLLVGLLLTRADDLRIDIDNCPSGARVIDCGVKARGGLKVGLALAEICAAGLAEISLAPADPALPADADVVFRTDHPVAACLAAQYAGWQISAGDYVAMGSGPMRAAAAKEPLIKVIGYAERPDVAVGVLETGALPSPEVCEKIAFDCGVAPERLTLLTARTASLAGTIQVVARSVETALHKLHELGFDVRQVVGGFGRAPLPPIAKDDLTAIGRTNDAVLYGARVTLWVDCKDDAIAEVGPKTPSSASPDHGAAFADLFQRYGHDFYKIDPLLFSPAVVTLNNLRSGRIWRFGAPMYDVLSEWFEP